MALFGKPKYTVVRVKKREMPEGLWTKCEDCSEIIYNKVLEENLKVCPKCQYHFTLGAHERIQQIVDSGTFQEFDAQLRSVDPLEFKGPKTYRQKLQLDQAATGLSEAAVMGEGKIDGRRSVVGVTDSRFIMGSMGSVVGEKVTRAIERAMRGKIPLVIVSGSGGGARMYEGMFSLMQMSKTSVALAGLHEAGVPFVSVLTDPTMAGVMASYASLGDVIMAEPRALIGFTGPRVIEQTIRQRLPEGFQRSEFLLEHGLIDQVVHRKQLKSTLSLLFSYLTP
ncbi:MAG: acetyl-CoA carboxylase carboxyltransferase subunit beta [Candidatus Omnitrophica bacterium]|nr:acetyl-CoA carboxylase carboxyltransferase subunit beta [Candidatus Omnitrophota bacterium]